MSNFWDFLLTVFGLVIKWGAIIFIVRLLCETAIQFIK